MGVFAGFNLLAYEPGAGHAQVGEQVRAIIQNKVQHLALAVDGDDGFTEKVEFSMEDILFELRRRSHRNYLEGQIGAELRADGFDFG